MHQTNLSQGSTRLNLQEKKSKTSEIYIYCTVHVYISMVIGRKIENACGWYLRCSWLFLFGSWLAAFTQRGLCIRGWESFKDTAMKKGIRGQ